MRIAWMMIAALLSACASPPATFHQIEPQLTASASALTLGKRIMVGPVALPAGLERPQLLLETPGGELKLLEFQRWAAPLDKALAQTIATNLSRQLGLASIYAYPQPGMDGGDLRLLLDIRQLRLQQGRQVRLEAVWQLLPARSGAALAGGYFNESVPLSSDEPAAAVQGVQQLVTQLSEVLAKDLSTKRQLLALPVAGF
ncbi:PqiC family protein [Neisseriaceae bacterium TC5R-5]|nr:PqiC family protein [Neisseriaceae bacterium TC5R-5]